MQEQAKESEYTRRKLERARQEVFHHMTKIKNEKETLEREVRFTKLSKNSFIQSLTVVIWLKSLFDTNIINLVFI